jgi:DNA polymerase-4
MDTQVWERAIMLVDMNAFFASVEQLDFPELRGLPVAVTNGEAGTCIITSSYEARACGIRTGMRLKEAYKLCPPLIRRASRPYRYADVSARIMRALHDVTPDVEVFSVDEAFLDVTRCQSLWGSPQRIAELTRAKVFEASGLSCSVGLSSNKTVAKYAAKLHKPDGMTVIAPEDVAARLESVPVTELCGIGHGIGEFLAAHGVHSCGDMRHLPVSVLAQRWGSIGRRIWLMAQGRDPSPVRTRVADPKSIGHGKVLPPETTDADVLRTYLLHMAEKVGSRLRRHDLAASQFFIGLRTATNWLCDKPQVAVPTNDGALIARLARGLLETHWQGEGIWQVQVTALDPRTAGNQLELFADPASIAARCVTNAVVDAVNARYGAFALTPARLLNRSDMPDVIPPSFSGGIDVLSLP